MTNAAITVEYHEDRIGDDQLKVIRQTRRFVRALAKEIPDFKADPTFTCDDKGRLCYTAGRYSLTLYAETLGLFLFEVQDGVRYTLGASWFPERKDPSQFVLASALVGDRSGWKKSGWAGGGWWGTDFVAARGTLPAALAKRGHQDAPASLASLIDEGESAIDGPSLPLPEHQTDGLVQIGDHWYRAPAVRAVLSNAVRPGLELRRMRLTNTLCAFQHGELVAMVTSRIPPKESERLPFRVPSPKRKSVWGSAK